MRLAEGEEYYRTPTLVNIWATAPFLHNNSLGMFVGDPSVTGRLVAYQDAMEKLLWPEKRPGVGTIRRTTQASTFTYEEGGRCALRKNTPIDLDDERTISSLPNTSGEDNFFTRLFCHITGTGGLNSLFLLADNAPDFVQDRGHTFGSSLSDADKQALNGLYEDLLNLHSQLGLEIVQLPIRIQR